MKILVLAMLLALPGRVKADSFKLTLNDGKNKREALYSSVTLLDKSNKVLLRKYTDKYGRVSLEVSHGTYVCEVTCENKIYRVQIVINGDSNLKEIFLQ